MKVATQTNGKILVWAAGNQGYSNPSPQGTAVVHDSALQGLSVTVVAINATNGDGSGAKDGKIWRQETGASNLPK